MILALMKLAGGGWIALGFLTLALALIEWRQSRMLARWALPVGTSIFYISSLAATWSVFRDAGAPSPWMPSLAMLGVVIVAVAVDAPWSRPGR